LPGSERAALAAARLAGPADATERIEVTVIIRRRAGLPRTAAGGPARISRDELRERYGSDPADQALVTSTLAAPDSGIEVLAADPGARQLTLSGTVAALSAVFGTSLSLVTSPGPGGVAVTHRYREGGLRVPARLAGIVEAVLGLDDRPQARPHFRSRAADAPESVSYTPPQLAALYGFPAGTDGSGQQLAIVELGGGFGSDDLDAYFTGLDLATPSVTAVSVAGGKNVAGQDPSGADSEVLLDIEVAGAAAPGAAQRVYFAPNSSRGFVEAVTAAVHATPSPTAISISWGSSEDSWTAQARSSLDSAIADGAALGITVCVASGDNGSTDGVADGAQHVDFPASSPHALACGGTSLQADPQAGVITAETVWNDGPQRGGGATGGGISDTFALPPWQAGSGVPAKNGQPGRGVPDVAGNADPYTGYQVRIDGQDTVVGGTSAVAPLWAALACRLAQAAGRPPGLLQETLYAGAGAGQPAAGLRDITSGSNGAYAAGPGWDPCTGLGVPDGPALLARLSAPEG
jgi:kumamolisin